jgi:hypothetical protein
VQVATAEAVDDGAAGLLQPGILVAYRPAAVERPLVGRQRARCVIVMRVVVRGTKRNATEFMQ